MTETTKFLITSIAALVGSGLGTAIVGALLSRRFNTQLETHKALLQRSGRIHERQVDALSTIHAKLDEALFYLQRATSAGKIQGEVSDKELPARMSRALAPASEELAKNRLLISESLGQKLDAFFNKMVSAGITLNLAFDPMVLNGQPRADLWDKARDTAYKEIPPILTAIRDEARGIIHG